MSEATQTNTLIDTLLGRDIDTDHGGLTLGDVIVLILDIVLLVYTGWRSYDFLTTSVPEGYELLALVGLWGLDIGAVAWSLVWIFGSATKYQDWTSMFFFVFDLVGVILTSLTDSLMYGQADSAMSTMLSGIAIVVVPLIVVANAVAGFIYHMTSPQTKQRRAKRRAENEHYEKMQEVGKLELDLQYAESFILARQDVLDKSVALAQIKMLQDQTEREVRLALRDQTGIRGLASHNAGENSIERIRSLRNRVNSLQQQAQTLKPASEAPGEEPLELAQGPELPGFSNNGHHPPVPGNFS
jgi:hypothetical protein